MPLPATFDNPADCPDFLKEHYKEDGGKLTLIEGLEIENVSALKNALGETKEKAKTFEKLLSPYGKVEHDGKEWKFDPQVDPAKYGEQSQTIENLQKQLKDKPDVNELAKEIAAENLKTQRETYESKIAELNQSHEEAQGSLMADYRRVALDQQIDSAIAQHGGKAHLLRPHLAQMATLDDDRQVILRGQDGKTMINNNAKNLSLNEYVETLRSQDDWKPAFNAPRSSGGGSHPAGRSTDFSKAGNPEPTHGAFFVEPQGAIIE